MFKSLITEKEKELVDTIEKSNPRKYKWLSVEHYKKIPVIKAEIDTLKQCQTIADNETNSLKEEIKALDRMLQAQIYNNQVLIDEHNRAKSELIEKIKNVLEQWTQDVNDTGVILEIKSILDTFKQAEKIE
jgi:hypothetical protein